MASQDRFFRSLEGSVSPSRGAAGSITLWVDVRSAKTPHLKSCPLVHFGRFWTHKEINEDKRATVLLRRREEISKDGARIHKDPFNIASIDRWIHCTLDGRIKSQVRSVAHFAISSSHLPRCVPIVPHMRAKGGRRGYCPRLMTV